MRYLTAFLLLGLAPLHAQGTSTDYDRAKELGRRANSLVTNPAVQIRWAADGKTAFVRLDGKLRAVDLVTGKSREVTEDDVTAAKVSQKEVPVVEFKNQRSHANGAPEELTIENATSEALDVKWVDLQGHPQSYGTIQPGKNWTQQTYAGHAWSLTDREGKPFAMVMTPSYSGTARITSKPAREPMADRMRSPDGKLEARQEGASLNLRETGEGHATAALSTAPNGERFNPGVEWAPDSRHLIAYRGRTITERQITLVESSPTDQVQPKYHTIPYPKPGDEIQQSFPKLFDAVIRREIPVDTKLFPNPWSISEGAWSADGAEYSFLYNQRGHQLMRLIGIRASDGQVRVIHEETSDTFIDYSGKTWLKRLPATRELLWASERDGWNHLYLIDEVSGKVKCQVTKGEWNVRSVESVDVAKRSVVFRAMGIIPGQDPYYFHFARVNFDGSGLTLLTKSDGTHHVDFSPDEKFLVDTWSRVDQPPVTELRRATDGGLVCELCRNDDAGLQKTGWSRPERFSAKGRDGKTDIYGVIVKPSNFDPSKHYPVIENIYSGPHDFFVPKSFYPWMGMNSLAELGFIVVQVDGMSTNWRGKVFHDVAWKNLMDAGLPDHIAWLKAAAQTRPWMDLSKVGIYGGSAGGQNSLSAILHHGDFYKVCVSDCGCHDNRMDKVWWNEAWMGWPVDESYARNSNVTDAAKLQGKLMLVVGELDHNVDPSSTMQVVNALEKADKDFELLIVTGSDHGAAETPYGQRRRADFFVRNLLGVEPGRRP